MQVRDDDKKIDMEMYGGFGKVSESKQGKRTKRRTIIFGEENEYIKTVVSYDVFASRCFAQINK